MLYKDWMKFAKDNYDIIKENYNSIVYTAQVYDDETQEKTNISLTLEGVMDKCMGTSMENQIRNAIMRSVYTGYGLEKNIQKVMNEFYVISAPR